MSKPIRAFCLALVLSACRHGAPAPVVKAPAPTPAVAAPKVADAVPARFECPDPGARVDGDDVERYCVPLDGEFRGSAESLIQVVAFSDFQCPFCARVLPALDKVLAGPGPARLYFRHMPLPFHPNARPAALASVAAGMQGKFWPMHDRLFAEQRALDPEDLRTYATALGLDVARFTEDRDSRAAEAVLEADESLAQALSVRGTPTFFVNGRPIRGAMPYPIFKALVDDENLRIGKLLAAGTPKGQIYAALMAGKGKGLGDLAALPAVLAPRPAPSEEAPAQGEPAVFRVPVTDAPTRGAKDALVTLVIFSDFQCPFCLRVEPTLEEVLHTYDGLVRIVWKNLPLSFHPRAEPAALAALAAHRQGKFWEMHRRIFAGQSNLGDAALAGHARALGLDPKRWKADQETARKLVDADKALAASLGVTGAPTIFVNGRRILGAQPISEFKRVVDEALVEARALVQEGTPAEKVYEVLQEKAKP